MSIQTAEFEEKKSVTFVLTAVSAAAPENAHFHLYLQLSKIITNFDIFGLTT